jgi:hypothetical protein
MITGRMRRAAILAGTRSAAQRVDWASRMQLPDEEATMLLDVLTWMALAAVLAALPLLRSQPLSGFSERFTLTIAGALGGGIVGKALPVLVLPHDYSLLGLVLAGVGALLVLHLVRAEGRRTVRHS